MVMVTGRIHYSRWTDNESQTRYGCEIIVDQVDSLAKAKEASKEETRWKPTRRLVAALPRATRYTWATVAPARPPVF